MKLKVILLLSMIGSSVMAQDKLATWQNPEVNEVNRMAAHADFTNKNECECPCMGCGVRCRFLVCGNSMV